ncbi:MAG: 7-cyano-7-deazaguanine synthase QueC [Actinomycetota bacterium]|nr:7-cyano-7-deazaguanine synthase QueC [Actinomycetota bacterium]
MKKGIVLLSGGIDSAVTLTIALEEGLDLETLTFDYGQRNRFEIEAARRIAHSFSVERQVVFVLDLSKLVESPLLEKRNEAQRDAKRSTYRDKKISQFYVPARNTIFLALALSRAESTEASDVFIGVGESDRRDFPDARPEFIALFNSLVKVGTGCVEKGEEIRINAPLLMMKKAEIIRIGEEKGVDFSLTQSCYQPGPSGRPCGNCESCHTRRIAFHEAGIEDPGWRA